MTALVALLALFAMSAVASASALANGPIVTTKPATNVSETKATLNGVVKPNGATTYWFEYGTNSYTKKTSEVSAGSGTKELEESQAIAELTPGTVYRFRIVAKNSEATTRGENEFFYTTAKAGLPEFVPSEGGKLPITLEYSSTTQKGGLSISSGTLPRCEGAYVKGEITGVKTLSLKIELRRCESPAFGCTFGEHYLEGEADVVALSGSANLVYINKAKTQVGIVLMQKQIEGICEGASLTLRGPLVIPLTPVNTKTSKPTLTIEGNGKGKQDSASYENEKGEELKDQLEMDVGETALEVDGALSLTANKAFTVSG
jgi:hypothetical protein